jgi:crotonobetainyl-CoA:carnitine CoA-transferase CaiB-like acyl-CoA transferase
MRDQTGLGQKVMSSLFEGAAFLSGQHMALAAVTGQPVEPWPASENPWAIYDLFDAADGGQIGIGIINDRHWRGFCGEFGLDDLLADARLENDEGRKQCRDEVIAALRQAVARYSLAEATAKCDAAGVPFAPVNRPEQLFDDPHLNQAGALIDTVLPDGRATKLPKLPLQMDGASFGLYREPPEVGEGSGAFLRSLGLSQSEIDELAGAGVISFKKD